MTPEPADPHAGPIEAEAARWLARRDRGFTADERAQFETWREGDPRRGEAEARLAGAWKSLDRLQCLAAGSAPLPNPNLLLRPPRARRIPARAAWGALAAAIVLCLGAGFWRTRWRTAPAPAAVTAITGGERHVLPDGSVAELDRLSAIDVKFTDAERHLELRQGRANFSVAKNPSRPFLVNAGGVVVQAVGTVFSVQLQGDSVEVLVSEGRVRIMGRSGGPVSNLIAGQRARLSRRAGPIAVDTLSHEDVESLLAWRAPRLVFTGQPLREVAEQFNRYNRHQLEIADPALGQIPIGGSFFANQVDAFVRLLNVSSGIQADRAGDRIILRRKLSAPK